MRLDRRINPMSVACIGMLTGLVLCSTAHAQGDARYAIIDMGDIGGRGTLPRAINGDGVVVGSTLTTQNIIKAFVWRDGSHIFLDPLTENLDADAYGINDAGEIAGESYIAPGVERAVLWLADGTPVDLGTLGGEESNARGINETRQVVGAADLAEGNHPYLWNDGEMTDLGNLGRPSGGGNAINSAGQIVGASGVVPSSARAFLWENGEMINLGTLFNGGQSLATDINDSGLIVGFANDSRSNQHAVIWVNRAIRSIHNAQIGIESVAYGINESGQVVGFLSVDGQFDHTSGFLYEGSGPMVDVMTLLPPRHQWRQLLNIADINDAGEIVAYGDRVGGGTRDYRGVLLTPVIPTLNLLGPQPGAAGSVNGIRATGCTPGRLIHFYYSTTGGGTLIPGCRHTDGVTLQLENPIRIGTATANEHGVATLTRFVPGQARNLGDILIQAVQPDGCKISQLVVHAFE